MDPNHTLKPRPGQLSAVATMLAMAGFGRHQPPARLFRSPGEKQRRKSAAEAKRERRKARNLRDSATQSKEAP